MFRWNTIIVRVFILAGWKKFLGIFENGKSSLQRVAALFSKKVWGAWVDTRRPDDLNAFTGSGDETTRPHLIVSEKRISHSHPFNNFLPIQFVLLHWDPRKEFTDRPDQLQLRILSDGKAIKSEGGQDHQNVRPPHPLIHILEIRTLVSKYALIQH